LKVWGNSGRGGDVLSKNTGIRGRSKAFTKKKVGKGTQKGGEGSRETVATLQRGEKHNIGGGDWVRRGRPREKCKG